MSVSAPHSHLHSFPHTHAHVLGLQQYGDPESHGSFDSSSESSGSESDDDDDNNDMHTGHSADAAAQQDSASATVGDEVSAHGASLAVVFVSGTRKHTHTHTNALSLSLSPGNAYHEHRGQ